MTRTNDLGQPIGEDVPGWTPRRPPDPDVLEGRTCRLERFAPHHDEALFGALDEDRSGRSWTYLSVGPCTAPEQFRQVADELRADPGLVTLAVLVDDEPLGMASYLRIDAAFGTVEVGWILFAPRLQRTTAATETMYLMARHVFDDLGYRRYEWKCDALNAPSMQAARRLGFGYEGTWRQATMYKGRNRDTAWFAMTDADWRLLRPAYESWLDPANQAGGRQRLSLSELTASALQRMSGG